MKVRYIKKTWPGTLTNGSIYDVMAIGEGYYRIKDESCYLDIPDLRDGYMFYADWFEVVDYEPLVAVPTDDEYWADKEPIPW